MFSIMRKPGEGVHNFKVPAELDLYNAAEFKGEILDAIEGSVSPVLVDCSELEYLDSSGIGAFIAVFMKVRTAGGRICFINARKSIARLIALTGLSAVLPFEDSAEDAMEYFQDRNAL